MIKKIPPILSNILIEAQSNYLTLSSTDMDISIVEKIKCNVEEEGTTTINSQILYDIVRKLDDDCEIEIISNNGKLLTLGQMDQDFLYPYQKRTFLLLKLKMIAL